MMGLFPLFCIRTVLVGAGYRTDAEPRRYVNLSWTFDQGERGRLWLPHLGVSRGRERLPREVD